MSDLRTIALLLLMILVVMFAILFGNLYAFPQCRVVDCSVAEISPDFTPEMRQQCRELRKHKL